MGITGGQRDERHVERESYTGRHEKREGGFHWRSNR